VQPRLLGQLLGEVASFVVGLGLGGKSTTPRRLSCLPFPLNRRWAGLTECHRPAYGQCNVYFAGKRLSPVLGKDASDLAMAWRGRRREPPSAAKASCPQKTQNDAEVFPSDLRVLRTADGSAPENRRSRPIGQPDGRDEMVAGHLHLSIQPKTPAVRPCGR